MASSTGSPAIDLFGVFSTNRVILHEFRIRFTKAKPAMREVDIALLALNAPSDLKAGVGEESLRDWVVGDPEP